MKKETALKNVMRWNKRQDYPHVESLVIIKVRENRFRKTKSLLLTGGRPGFRHITRCTSYIRCEGEEEVNNHA